MLSTLSLSESESDMLTEILEVSSDGDVMMFFDELVILKMCTRCANPQSFLEKNSKKTHGLVFAGTRLTRTPDWVMPC